MSALPDKPIPAEKLDLLQRSLDELRRNGLKTLLRFAYEKDMNVKYGPKPEWILKHIEQLQPILQKNAAVIYVLQAGFIGAWGEWHSATHIPQDDYGSRAAVVKRLLEVLPEELQGSAGERRVRRQIHCRVAGEDHPEVVAHLPAHRAGDGDAARWRDRPQARGDVDAVAGDVFSISAW